MSFLVLRAYLKLIQFDLLMARKNFAALYSKVREYPRGKQVPSPDAADKICAAVDMACIWYWKEVPAQMVIGAQQMPFKAHAWVEVNGRVVNDKPYVPQMYAVLDRC